MVRGPFGLPTVGLGPLGSEVRGPFGTLYDVGAFGLAMTSALNLVVFRQVPRSLSVFPFLNSVPLYRGPRSVLVLSRTSALSGFHRRPRFLFWSFSWSDSVILDRGPWFLQSLCSRTRPSEVRGPWSFKCSLRRRRFRAFFDVLAYFFGLFHSRTLFSRTAICIFAHRLYYNCRFQLNKLNHDILKYWIIIQSLNVYKDSVDYFYKRMLSITGCLARFSQ